jgi:hypothetical protein
VDCVEGHGQHGDNRCGPNLHRRGCRCCGIVAARHSLSLLERYRVESAVKANLKDPESALFTDYRIARVQDGVKVCGYVNAKNAMGGYVGPRLFYGVLKDGWFSLNAIDTGEKPKFGEKEIAAAACSDM